ncbi:ATP-binding protein [Yinghuangia seranimata]|uniref:ATP-binding protein n=1 Tax=Yinghuangia seranimata TaxID=408067 RepID=UPI00248BD6BA|nr:ATP-binding protein [Yinghuangia seranimata]MDI2128228.1 ATP-binding protein [Yinghuangia seranimata]
MSDTSVEPAIAPTPAGPVGLGRHLTPVSGPAVATATAAGVLGLTAAVISILTLHSDGSNLHAGIVALFYVPSGIIGVVSAWLQRRFVGDHMRALDAEITRRDEAALRLTDDRDRLNAEIAELNRRQQLLLAEDDLLRERMQESFVNLSMRSLTLVERQLDLIEKLEHTEENAQRLDDLFRLDHLATRMRRNSENVLVLADADARAGHRPPGTLLDVVRAAVSEIEYYERIDVGHIPRAELAGHTADDISHLLAELLENAAAYSPPSTRVTVAGRTLENRGILLTVEDEGFGVAPDRLPELNAQLQGGRAEAGSSDLAGLGVFVVGALAVRHGVRVQLRPRQDGGLAAIVMLPPGLLHGPGPTPAEISRERDLDRVQSAPPPTRVVPPREARIRSLAMPTATPTPTPTGERIPDPADRPAAASTTPAAPAAVSSGSTAPVTLPSGLPKRQVATPTPPTVEEPDDAAARSESTAGESTAGESTKESAPRPGSGIAESDDSGSLLGVTEKGLPKRIPRTRPDDEPAPPSATPPHGTAVPDPVRDSGPIAAEELRRRLSGFQMGTVAARQDAAEGAEPDRLGPTAAAVASPEPSDRSEAGQPVPPVPSAGSTPSATPAPGGENR